MEKKRNRISLLKQQKENGIHSKLKNKPHTVAILSFLDLLYFPFFGVHKFRPVASLFFHFRKAEKVGEASVLLEGKRKEGGRKGATTGARAKK